MSKVKKPRLWRWGLLVVGVCLTLMLLVSATPAFADEPLSASGIQLPPGIAPVIVLQGSNYDMGFQYYQQINQIFGPFILQKMQRTLSPDQLLVLKAYQWYVKQNTPEVIDMIRGMADGATAAGVQLSYAQVLANYTGLKDWGAKPAGSENDGLPPTTCSIFAAWGRTTSDGHLIAGNSQDAPFGNRAAIIAFPSDGSNSYITNVSPPALYDIPSMNNKGLFIGGASGEATRPEDSAGGYDFFGWTHTLHELRFCNTAAQAKDMQLSWKFGGSSNKLFADVGGDAYVLELTAVVKAVRKARDFGEGDFIYARNNYFTPDGGAANLGGQPGKFYPHGGWALDPPAGVDDPGGYADIHMASVRVNQTFYNMFSEYRGQVDLDFAKMMYRYAGKMPKDPWDTAEYRKTKARAWETPGNLNNARTIIAEPANGDTGVMHICTGPAARVASPYEAGPADDYYQIANTHTFYDLVLSASPAQVVSSANSTARHDIALAYQRLMYKNYGDVGFEGLNALYDKANSEYYEGVNWNSRAALATGNDKVLYQALALTAFTRAQCHAQQVYEALAKPPVTPSDLGLRPYKAYEYGF